MNKKEYVGFGLLAIILFLLLVGVPYLLWKESLEDLGVSFTNTFVGNFVIYILVCFVLGGKRNG